MSSTRVMICAAALAATPLAAEAQGATTFRCQGADGKKHYGNTIPQQCYGRVVEQLNAQGTVVKRIDPSANDNKNAAAKGAENAASEKLDAANREAMRRNRALIATYTSEKDIEEQRARALADKQKAVREQEARVADLKKRRAGFDKELEFSSDKSGKSKLPPKLQEEIRQTDFELKVEQDSLEVKKKEVDNVNARYDDDKKRYLELSAKTPAERAVALGMDKGATIVTKGQSSQDNLRNQREAQSRAAQERSQVERLEREREADRRRSAYEQQQRQYQQQRQTQQR